MGRIIKAAAPRQIILQTVEDILLAIWDLYG